MTGTAAPPPSSPLSFPYPPGMSGLPIPPWATPSSTASSTTPTASSSRASPCGEEPPDVPLLLTPPRRAEPQSPRPQTATQPRPASFGTPGWLQLEKVAGFDWKPRLESPESADSAGLGDDGCHMAMT